MDHHATIPQAENNDPQAALRAGQFTMQNYPAARPFASFLPGIAGPMGIPMWVFYVNRGQAIASFGIESKDHAILEYQPANKAYQMVAQVGFRTFIKLPGGEQPFLYEPFSPLSQAAGNRPDLHIAANEITLVEENPALGLRVQVCYFILPEEPFAALVRQVTITNIAQTPVAADVLDGLPTIIPYGANNFMLKEIGRTLEAWMSVLCPEGGPPFYRLSASPADTAWVEEFQAGNFFLAFDSSGQRLPVLVDPATVFGQDTALATPAPFVDLPMETLLSQRQITDGRSLCAFSATSLALAPGESGQVNTLVGHAPSPDFIMAQQARLLAPGYLEQKRAQAVALTESLTSHVATRSGEARFDAYCAQNFLDNVLRGGWPILLGTQERQHVYHIYSRKHGDLERDYNAFFLAAEYYSQGNGNYRDINQNRRSDVLLEPRLGAFNVMAFMNLLQADGYNPLVVQGCRFSLLPEQRAAILALAGHPPALARLLEKTFTPGQVLRAIEDWPLPLPAGELLAQLLGAAEQHLEAVPGEGYWVDHWTYNLDLIDTYLAIYPEQKDWLLFAQHTYTFYDNDLVVRPRAEKYVLTPQGPRQYHAVTRDEEKQALIQSRAAAPHLMRSQNGRGEIFRTNLFTKLLCLAAVKFSTLDPAGMGIEMEADKPGWYDALNGLPALFGSSLPETYELLRLLNFLLQAIRERPEQEYHLPVEVHQLFATLAGHLETWSVSSDAGRDFAYWDAAATARERYREQVRLGFCGELAPTQAAVLRAWLEAFQVKVQDGLAHAQALNGGLPPTYFTYQVVEYEHREASQAQTEDVLIRPTRFEQQILPLFLEGPVHALKCCPGQPQARQLYAQVQASDLFDQKLGMYKVNASLAAQPAAIGRARAFPPGWLENESIWLHMAYKYLLEVLRAGLHAEFCAEMRRGLVPFFDPQIYGRSPLENASFVVSSAHADESLHGAGFVARLSGSTAEFISIWHHMLAGERPFYLAGGELNLRLQPVLPGWLFDADGCIAFRFLGCCDVVYHNPARGDTFAGLEIARLALHMQDGAVIELPGGLIGAPYAAQVRAGLVRSIHLYFAG